MKVQPFKVGPDYIEENLNIQEILETISCKTEQPVEKNLDMGKFPSKGLRLLLLGALRSNLYMQI
jgi:hypothetical protein|tara:strand:+ start:605 stop:799 length:195 start_codon:yes stop_codon:yes gene_type:complete